MAKGAAPRYLPGMTTPLILDCRDLLCPLPVLRARKRLASLPPGTLLDVQATDPMAAIDLPHYCAQSGHTYLGATPGAGFTTHHLKRGPNG